LRAPFLPLGSAGIAPHVSRSLTDPGGRAEAKAPSNAAATAAKTQDDPVEQTVK
jgi:hypothetical protein